jgi:hypothetical protein
MGALSPPGLLLTLKTFFSDPHIAWIGSLMLAVHLNCIPVQVLAAFRLFHSYGHLGDWDGGGGAYRSVWSYAVWTECSMVPEQWQLICQPSITNLSWIDGRQDMHMLFIYLPDGVDVGAHTEWPSHRNLCG